MVERLIRERRVVVAGCLAVLVAGGVLVARAAGQPPAPPPVEATWPETTAESAAVVDTAETIVVHVSGAVAQPGVYRLASGSRVTDAIEAAGGATGTARVGDLNLAEPLGDGVRVHVPNATDPHAPPPAGVSGGGPGAAPATGPVDLNTADAEALDTLPGIGPVLAARIVADREANGPFETVADLDRVAGVGPGTIAELDGLVIA